MHRFQAFVYIKKKLVFDLHLFLQLLEVPLYLNIFTKQLQL